jgi:uncharacterized phage protein gp47/JayE
MPFERPSIATLVERTSSDLESRGFGAETRVRRSIIYVLARVIAGVAHGLYGFIAWASRQFLPDTQDDANLERYATMYGIARVPAARATGSVILTGNTGTSVPVGLRLQRSDGYEFLTTAENIVIGGTVIVPVEASTTGVAGNTDAGVQLAVAAQVSGLSATAVVASGDIAGGADGESLEALRERVLTFMRKRPQGGAAHDYVAWALEVPGVTRAWPKPHLNGLGTMGLFFVRDGDADPIPSPTAVAAVQAHIDALRPVTVKDFTVYAPAPLAVDFEIELDPDTTANRAAVVAQLQDLFRREAEPGAVIPLTHCAEAISLAPGEFDHDLIAPAADIAPAPGYMPVLGDVSFVL